MRRFRIAIISNYFLPHLGGAENQNRLIGEELVRRGHFVTVLTRRFDRQLSKREMCGGIQVRRLGPAGPGVVVKWLTNLSTAWCLAWSRPGFDIVLVTQMSPHALGPAVASYVRRLAIVLLPIEHGELSGDVSDRTLVRLPVAVLRPLRVALDGARHWAYRRAKRVIVISSALACEARSFGFPQSTLVSIPNAVDTMRFRPPGPEDRKILRKALGLPLDAEVVVWVGRLVRKKGIETLIEAWERVLRARPGALLVIVGPGAASGHPNDVEELVRAAISHYSMTASVILAGGVTDVERYLRASDLFVLTSEQEGSPNAVVEAMACGLPVVTSRIQGTDHLVDEGCEGLKFAVGDVRQLEVCITRLLGDPMMLRRMGAAARARVDKTMALERVAASFERVFEDIADANAVRRQRVSVDP